MGIKSQIIKARETYEVDGIKGLLGLIARRILRRSDAIRDDYRTWVKKYGTLKGSDRKSMERAISGFLFQPRISVLMPVYNPDEAWLRFAIESVRKQVYPNWELCIADDLSTRPHVREVLESYAEKDSRIKITFRTANGHISAASNSALRLATGEFCALLDHDDELSVDALFWLVNEINHHPGVDLIYSDEDKIDVAGVRHSPHFKPDWDPFLFCSFNLITHLACYRTQVLRNVNGFRIGFEGSQDYDLGLRVADSTEPYRIRHIPRVLYHWRSIPGSTAVRPSEKDYAGAAAKKAIEEHLQRRNAQGEVLPAFGGGYHRVSYAIPDRTPVVTLVVCVREVTETLKANVKELFENTDYSSVEFIVVDSSPNASEGSDFKATVLPFKEAYQLPAMRNLAARNARGEVLVFLAEGIRPASSGWLKELVSFAIRPEIGAVGGRILTSDGKVHHAGLALGLGGVVGRVDRAVSRDDGGYMSKALLIHGVSAVSGECLAVKKRLFEEMGGFEETNLAQAFSDVDFCLELKSRGYKNLYTPYAEFLQSQAEAQADRSRAERHMQLKWGDSLVSDPYYNPNLGLESETGALAFPPRVEFSFSKTQHDKDKFPNRVLTGIPMPLGQN